MTSYEHWIGKRVQKKSSKPFKSGLKTATVLGVIEHPQRRGKPAFVFHEDDSHVSCEQCFPLWDDVIEQCETLEHIDSLSHENDNWN